MMHLSKIFKDSFQVAMRQKRVAAILYFIQLGMALTLGMQVFSVLESSIGHSLEVNKLLAGYDHTVITDFLKVHGASITPLLGQLRWLILVWLFFSVFLNAGLIYGVLPAPPNSGTAVQRFWQGGYQFFFSFLKINLFFIVLAALWSIIMLVPLALSFEPALQYFSSEKPIVWIALGLLGLFFLGLIFLFSWSVLSRISAIQANAGVFAQVRNGWRLLLQHKGRYCSIVLGFYGIQIGLLVIYWNLESLSTNNSAGLIFLFFLLQQAFIFFRIQLRQMMYASIAQLSNSGTGL